MDTGLKQLFSLTLFALIGLLAFCMEALVIDIGSRLGFGEILPRFFGFPIAVTWTWYANRSWNFCVLARPSWKEYLSYLSGMALGALLNFLVYTILVLQTIWTPLSTVTALGIATLVAMSFNFFFAKNISFKA